MYSTFHFIEIEGYEDASISVTFTGSPNWENDGIGSYEFWGAKGFDHGATYATCEVIEWDKTQYTPEENNIIAAYLESNFEKIEGELSRQLEAERQERQRWPEPEWTNDDLPF